MEIGSLLVPMVLTSQMAFIERWESKYLKVTGIYKQICSLSTRANPASISGLQDFSKSICILVNFQVMVASTSVSQLVKLSSREKVAPSYM